MIASDDNDRNDEQFAANEGQRDLLRDLQDLINNAEGDLWRIGDLINRIKNEYKLTTTQIKGRLSLKLKWKRNRLDEIAATAREFKGDLRADPAFSFYDFENIRKAQKRMPAHRRVPLEKVIEIVRENKPRNNRELMNLFLDDLYEKKLEAIRAELPAIESAMGEVVDQPHLGRWEAIVERIADDSLSLIIADPPYAYRNPCPYTRTKESAYAAESKRSGALRYEWDNGDPEDALATTVNLFKLCRAKLKDNAPLLLCQEGGVPDDMNVRRAAEEYGWACVNSLTWVKSAAPTNSSPSPAPSNMDKPYGAVTEKILVFAKKDKDGKPQRLERLRNFPNGDVLLYDSATRAAFGKFVGGSEDIGDHHIFEHPWELAADLIRRHVPENSGAIIFEPFGCSAFASVAAIKLGLRWIYCESNRNNYDFGRSRLLHAQGIGDAINEAA